MNFYFYSNGEMYRLSSLYAGVEFVIVVPIMENKRGSRVLGLLFSMFFKEMRKW